MRPTTYIIAALLCATLAHAQGEAARREKCAYLWRTLNAKTYAPSLVEAFCREHEMQGIAASWWHSFIYAHSGSDGLNPRMRYSAGGMTARGLMDCTERQYPLAQALRRFRKVDFYDTYFSIANHCFQAMCIHQSTGREGFALMRAVFLPRSPDGGRAWEEQNVRWASRDRRFRKLLAEGYRDGALAR